MRGQRKERIIINAIHESDRKFIAFLKFNVDFKRNLFYEIYHIHKTLWAKFNDLLLELYYIILYLLLEFGKSY